MICALDFMIFCHEILFHHVYGIYGADIRLYSIFCLGLMSTVTDVTTTNVMWPP